MISWIALSLLTWSSLGLRLSRVSFEPAHIRHLAAFSGCLPPMFLCAYVALIMSAQDDRQNLSLHVPGTLAPGVRQSLQGSWLREKERVRRARRELVLYAVALGILASALLQAALVLYVHSPPDAGVNPPSLGQQVAAAAATAVAVAFSVSFGNILVRSARGDATGRTLAVACRCVTFGSLAAAITAAMLVDVGFIVSIPQALLTGLVTSFLGEPLVETVFQALTIIFGASTGGDDNLDKFELIDGLDEVERLRLNDLGITSLQGLAFASTSFLYFFTRYGLRRICDWQDQALLLILVGRNANAALWLQRFRGASKVRAVPDPLSPADLAALDMDRAEDVRALMDRVGAEPQIDEIHAWSQCTPRLSGDAATRQQLEPEVSEAHGQVEHGRQATGS
ncbi:MAG TPA: hypothetical protein VJU61_28355 [Polyangiaceae bacterium]|nr:hypothetical protein [Polyangiaceae bacterium]